MPAPARSACFSLANCAALSLLVGRSAPNFELLDGATLGERLRSAGGVWLDFDAARALQALASRWREPIASVACEARDRLGASALLVRPDGVVAWAGEGAPNLDAAAQAALRWFGESEASPDTAACGQPKAEKHS